VGCWVAPRREKTAANRIFFWLGFRRASGSEDTGGFLGGEGMEDQLYMMNLTLPKTNITPESQNGLKLHFPLFGRECFSFEEGIVFNEASNSSIPHSNTRY